jgi:hypothetical protein
MASVNLTWNAVSPAPVSGYRVKFWPTASPTVVSTISPNPTTNSYTITGLGAGVSYSGTVESTCTGGGFSTPVPWVVTVPVVTNKYYTVSKFNCASNCIQVGSNGAYYARSTQTLVVGKFYKSGTFSYRVESLLSSTPTPIEVDLSSSAQSDTCSAACGIVYYSYNAGRCQDCSGNPTNGYITNYTTVTSPEILMSYLNNRIVYISGYYLILRVSSTNYTTVSEPGTYHLYDGNTTEFYNDCRSAQGCTSGCPVPEMNILINPNESVKAGDLKIGDEVYTRHQDTFEWGTYKVTSAERYIQPTVKVVIDEFQVEVSASHKFLTNDLKFVSISDLLVGDLIETTKGAKPILSVESTGTKEVVKLEIENAHTYVVENIVSHNKIRPDDPDGPVRDSPDALRYV